MTYKNPFVLTIKGLILGMGLLYVSTGFATVNNVNSFPTKDAGDRFLYTEYNTIRDTLMNFFRNDNNTTGDLTDDKVGIGIANPQADLDVGETTDPVSGACPAGYEFVDYNGDTNIDNGECWRGFVLKDGQIGIGTVSPTQALDVVGNIQLTGDLQMAGDLKTVNNKGLQIKDVGGTYRNAIMVDSVDKLLLGNSNLSGDILIQNTGKVGIGTAAPAGKTHIYSAASGATLTDTNADELVLENSDNAGLTILTPNTNYGQISFGDGEDDNQGRIRFEHLNSSMRFHTAGATEAMRITSSGDVGIGTTSPDRFLHLEQGSALASSAVPGLRLTRTSTATPAAGLGTGIDFEIETADGNNEVIGVIEGITTDVTGAAEVGAIAFKTMTGGTTAAERMRITGSGRIGIGTTSPETTLHISATDGMTIPVGTTAERPGTPIAGTVRYNETTAQFEGYSASSWESLVGLIDVDRDTYISAENSAGADNDQLRFFTFGGERMTITSTGEIGIGITTPTSKLHLPQETDAVTPTLSFGDGDTGIYESVDDTLNVAIEGTSQFVIDGTGTQMTAGGRLINAAATATSPSFLPEFTDTNTGLGSAGDDKLSFISGGKEMMRLVKGVKNFIQIPNNAWFKSVETTGVRTRNVFKQGKDDLVALGSGLRTDNNKGLIAHWTLSEDSQTTSGAIADRTGNANHGTLTGSAVFTADYGNKGLGDQVVTDETFDTACATNWTCGTGWTIAGGVATSDGAQEAVSNLIETTTLTSGQKYAVTFTLNSVTAGSVTAIDDSSAKTTAGTYTEIITATQTSGGLTASADFVGTIDNISIREYISGQAMVFDGAATKIDTGSDMIGTGAVTVAGWMNPSGWGENDAGRILDNGKLMLFVDTTNDTLNVSSDGSTTVSSAAASVALNTWQFVSVTRTAAGVVNIYIGDTSATPVLSGTANQASGTPVAGTTNTIIGNTSIGDRTFDGAISDLRIYNRILSVNEIQDLWAGYHPDIEISTLVSKEDAGQTTLYNQPVSASSTAGTEHSAALSIDSNPILKVIGLSDGMGGITDKSITMTGDINHTGNLTSVGNLSSTGTSYFNGLVGIGTTAPGAGLTIGTGTADLATGADDLYVTGNLEVDGDVYLGDDMAVDNMTVTGTLNVQGAMEFTSGDLDMADSRVLNIGAAGTDFTSAGGLTLADDLAVNTDDLFVDVSTGNVGIGTTSPDEMLHIFDSAGVNNFVKVDASGVNMGGLSLASGGINKWSIANRPGDTNNLYISASPTSTDGTAIASAAKVTIQQDGNVGIGTITPSQKLEVAGNIAVSGTVDGIDISDLAVSVLENVHSVFVGKTSGTHTGNLGTNGYRAGNDLCAADFAGSHLCSQAEIIYTIETIADLSTLTGWSGDVWLSTGGAKYSPATLPVNDCNGWTHGVGGTYLGNFWRFDLTTGGSGKVSNCGVSFNLSCCK